MAVKKILKTISLEKMINKHVGKKGSAKREAFENELRIEITRKKLNVS